MSSSDSTSHDRELVSIVLLDLPVDLWALADDEGKDLMREFTLITLQEVHDSEVPQRLLDLVAELEESYGNLGDEQTARLVRARAAGEAEIDRLEYRLPATVAADIERLATMLDEADDYCRQGKHLLSLASSPGAKAFRDWFLDEMLIQLEGGNPTPWPLSAYSDRAQEVARE